MHLLLNTIVIQVIWLNISDVDEGIPICFTFLIVCQTVHQEYDDV